MRNKKFVLCVLVLIIKYINCNSILDTLNLELVQVVFRHGERTLQKDELKLLKNGSDYLQKSWEIGQLTKNGMVQEYKIGEMLRKRYDDFLGASYKPQYVHAESSDFDRTKASLQLVLASLYPPTSSELKWNEDLNWMPIPTHYTPRNLDILFNVKMCPKYDRLFKQLMSSNEIKNGSLRKYQGLFKFFKREFPDVDITLEQLFYLNNIVNIFMALDIPLPNWYSPEIHENLIDAAKFYLDVLSYTPEMRKLYGGIMSRRLVENMNINGQRRNSRRIYLYSGHEFTIHAVAKAHNISLGVSPAFGSALILEKWRDYQDEIYVKMYYWTGPSEELQPIQLENCDEPERYYTIDEYLNFIKNSLPSNDDLHCVYKKLTSIDIENALISDTE